MKAAFLFLLSIFGPNIYFSVAAILGLDYKGIESGNFTYWIYMITLFVFSVMYYFFLKLKYNKINKKEINVILYLLLFFSYFSIHNILNQNSIVEDVTQQFILFIIFVVPAIIAGWYFSTVVKESNFIIKNMELIMIIFTISTLVSSIEVIISGDRFVTIGGGTYQTASYISAFAFGINLYYLIWGSKLDRYVFTKMFYYKSIQIILLFLQLFSLFVSGGRGAFVLIILYLFIYVITLMSKKNISLIMKYLSLSVVFFILIIYLYNTILSDYPLFSNGIERIFAFISPKGINWEGTSGRDEVYKEILSIIKDNPIFGVGFFNYPQPHNIFLEILVSTGIFGLLLFVSLIYPFLKKMIIMIKKDFNKFYLIVIFLYPVALLMFSGSFLNNKEFWFVVSYVYFTNGRRLQN